MTSPDAPAGARPEIRTAVRALLSRLPEYGCLERNRRRDLAKSLVRVLELAQVLVEEENETRAPLNTPGPAISDHRLARPLSAQDQFGGRAVEQVASTAREIVDAVSFPRFVEELINGVFTAMIGSSVKQMEAYVDLLDSVASSTESFAARNMGNEQARAWLVQQFPRAYELTGGSDEPTDDDGWEVGDGDDSKVAVQLRPGASNPTPEAIRSAMGLEADATIQTADPERLLPLVRSTLAARRQSMLSTLVMLGLNRIVVDSGRLNASMRFHIDAQSAAREDRGSVFDFRNTVSGGASFAVGPWGASASMTNTIGYVKTEQSQTTEEVNVDLDLNSSVEINFKSDYLPLNQLANSRQAEEIRGRSRNPDAPTESRPTVQQRRTARVQRDEARRAEIRSRLPTPPSQATEDPEGRRQRERAERLREQAGGGTPSARQESPGEGGGSSAPQSRETSVGDGEPAATPSTSADRAAAPTPQT